MIILVEKLMFGLLSNAAIALPCISSRRIRSFDIVQIVEVK